MAKLLLDTFASPTSDLVTCSTYPDDAGDTNFNQVKIHFGHAYTILDVKKVTLKKKPEAKKGPPEHVILIKIRNPHGNTSKYSGEYRHADPNW